MILACGGFGGNYAMLKEHCDMERPFYLGPTSNKGWGIEAGTSVGAKTAYATLPDLPGYDSMVYGTVGGLIVNENAEVLKDDDTVIENLYAVGELTCVQVLDTVHVSAGENSSWNLRFHGKPYHAYRFSRLSLCLTVLPLSAGHRR